MSGALPSGASSFAELIAHGHHHHPACHFSHHLEVGIQVGRHEDSENRHERRGRLEHGSGRSFTRELGRFRGSVSVCSFSATCVSDRRDANRAGQSRQRRSLRMVTVGRVTWAPDLARRRGIPPARPSGFWTRPLSGRAETSRMKAMGTFPIEREFDPRLQIARSSPLRAVNRRTNRGAEMLRPMAIVVRLGRSTTKRARGDG